MTPNLHVSTEATRASRPRAVGWSGSILVVLAALLGCEDGRAPPDTSPYQSEISEGLGIAIVILVDNSGSMRSPAEGDDRPKFEVAQAAIREMLAVTDSFVASTPDLPVKVAVFRFSGSVDRVLTIREYNRDELARAIASIPEPDGQTAIGDAMRLGREELYRSGVFRKHLIVITDGENTDGRDPADEAREIHRRSEGAVRIHFVAFDTDPAKFGFLSDVQGQIFAASDAESLRIRLDSLYRTQILAEAMDEVEPTPQQGR